LFPEHDLAKAANMKLIWLFLSNYVVWKIISIRARFFVLDMLRRSRMTTEPSLDVKYRWFTF
jgi:hypothetical protein